MLAGGTEPFPIWDQHEWRPQAGGVVSTVAQVAQQNLQQQTKPAAKLKTTSAADDSFNVISVAVTNNQQHTLSMRNVFKSNKCGRTRGGKKSRQEGEHGEHTQPTGISLCDL